MFKDSVAFAIIRKLDGKFGDKSPFGSVASLHALYKVIKVNEHDDVDRNSGCGGPASEPDASFRCVAGPFRCMHDRTRFPVRLRSTRSHVVEMSLRCVGARTTCVGVFGDEVATTALTTNGSSDRLRAGVSKPNVTSILKPLVRQSVGGGCRFVFDEV